MNTPIVVQSSSNKKGNTHALIEEVFKDTPPIFIRISEHKISFVSETGSYSENDEFSSLLKLLVRKNNKIKYIYTIGRGKENFFIDFINDDECIVSRRLNKILIEFEIDKCNF